MLQTMRLHPQPVRKQAGRAIRSCDIHRESGRSGASVDVQTLWFDVPDHADLPADDDGEAYVVALVMEAMREGCSLHVHGTVSRELLGNLQELQEVWVRWRPSMYRRVALSADRVDSTRRAPAEGAICAFSGGVDATFSVWRNSAGRNGHRTQPVSMCAMVHGFDIPLQDAMAFDVAFARAERTLSDLQLPLHAVRTNYREIAKVRWEDSFAAALVATLSNCKGLAGTCLFGSAKPYDALVIPSGSSPISDHLLGSSAFRVIHDGASHCRSGKVREIAEWRTGAEHLRVCWDGEGKGGNCGRCEKCLRTMVNFAANGLPVPGCFPTREIPLDAVRRLDLRSDMVRAEWQQIAAYARTLSPAPGWLPPLQRKLAYRAARSALKQFLKAALRVARPSSARA